MSSEKNSKKIKVASKSNPPQDYDKLRPTLKKFDDKLEFYQSAKHNPSKSKNELHWDILRIHHQKNRYIYSLYYKRKIISKDLYLWLLKYKVADKQLIAKWRKQGYEKLCCLQCIGKTVCMCRVPKSVRKTNEDFQCVKCGCRGCASSD